MRETIPMEDNELLEANRTSNGVKAEINGKATSSYSHEPPDGGIRAYSIIIGSFLTNGLLFGVINSYSVIGDELSKRLLVQNVTNYDTRSALVGSLTMGTTFLLSPLSGVLTAIIGLRMTAVLGGSVAAASLLISSFVVNYVDALCLTYGFLYGLGASLAYTPSLAILGHYFKRRLGLVNGIVTIGSSVFTVIIPPLMDFAVRNYGLEGLFRVLAVITFGIALCGLLYKPIPVVVIDKSTDTKDLKSLVKKVFDIHIWKVKKYRYWALSMPVALFGYFVPYVKLKQFMNLNFPGKNDNIAIQCIGAASGVGRLVFGFLGDRNGIDRVMLQQISFYCIGCFTILLPFVSNFALLIVISLCMGLFDGAFISLIGPIAIQFCGSAYAAQAIGGMLGLAAVPLSIGPPIAAQIFTMTHDFTLPFVLAGISPIVGASLMFAIRFQKKR
ncbi:monocarboxylate transporter 10 [Aricia agestis]|uniref:monocarboxylate transporter 10 n=1 Tax=Aricia agestis TaxID=91739 RepID=UPI001C2025C0|nr:monocarboxylate transporter 10 [Aricia agestis]